MRFLDSLAEKALAGAPTLAPAGELTVPPNADAGTIISNVYNTVFDIFMLIAGGLAVLYLMWMGIQYITAGGNAERTKAARAGIVNAIIGIVVIIAAFAIVRFAISIGRLLSEAS